jgi:GNAT superfamily N-acetyltransferase
MKTGQSWTAQDGVAHLECSLAEDTESFDGAFRLIHDQYAWRDYIPPDPSGRRLSLHNALPSTKVFVARAGSRVVATMTLIQDSAIGLPMDEIYRKELGGFRTQGRSLAEVSALAIDPAYRAHGVSILIRLVRVLLLYSAEVCRLDDLCIAVNPRHVDFYQRLFPDARRFGQIKAYRKVNGAPAIGLRLDLDTVRDAMAAVHAGESPNAFHDVLFDREVCVRALFRLRQDLPRAVLTPQQFLHFFAGQEVLASAPSEAIAVVQSHYPELSLARLRRSPRSSEAPVAVRALTPALATA